MTASALKSGAGDKVSSLLAAAVNTIGETLGSLVGQEIKVTCGDVTAQEPADIVAGLPRACAVARGAMDKDYAGKSLATLLEVPDAVAMAGLLMMSPPDVIEKNRKTCSLEGEDVEAFGELGNVLYSGYSNVLRDKIANFDVRMQDQGQVAPGVADHSVLGEGRQLTMSFRMKVGEYPESVGLIAIDMDTATRWNGGPIEEASGGGSATASEARRPDEEGIDEIPAAPIRGSLAAFVIQGEVFKTLRLSCRRVGLELRRHGRGEIPNPAAHRQQIVVIDVPPGEDRRFDWCRRIKELSETTPVVLLLHHPSRQRVTQAFLSRADAILGFPCEELQLSQKLEELVPDAPTPTSSPDPSDEG